MKSLKITGVVIFMLSLILAVMFNMTSKKAQIHNDLINTINEQKDFTQEISKNIFYIYRNQESSTNTLDDSIKLFLENMSTKEDMYTNKRIIELWNDFYLHVQYFRDQINARSIYTNLLLEKSVKEIYNTNLKLIFEFDRLIKKEQTNFNKEENIYITVQYILFSFLVILIIYIFTQIKGIISFIQKFLSTSKTIILNSSIKELKPIEIEGSTDDISQAKDNFNILVNKINSSIRYSGDSIEHSYKSLEIVEHNIEDFIEFIYTMNENPRDKELRKKEDAVIQSFEELATTAKKLKNLKKDLDDLISHTRSDQN